MTDDRWTSSYTLQKLLLDLGCEILNSNNPEVINWYNPATSKVVTITNKGHIPPKELTQILYRLGISQS